MQKAMFNVQLPSTTAKEAGTMFALEHSKATYWFDYVIYVAIVGGLAIAILLQGPHGEWLSMLAIAAAGWAAWSFVEYAMHRFVLHRIEPFKTWHARHHDRPTALISSPTALSATLITLLVFVPALLASTWWPAASLTLGVTTGYLGYAVCHHATHHWRARRGWTKARKRWHAIHHRRGAAACYGVTSIFWDRVFGTGPKDHAVADSGERIALIRQDAMAATDNHRRDPS